MKKTTLISISSSILVLGLAPLSVFAQATTTITAHAPLSGVLGNSNASTTPISPILHLPTINHISVPLQPAPHTSSSSTPDSASSSSSNPTVLPVFHSSSTPIVIHNFDANDLPNILNVFPNIPSSSTSTSSGSSSYVGGGYSGGGSSGGSSYTIHNGSTTTTYTPSVTQAPLRPRTKSRDVAVLQWVLKVKGAYTGTVDGSYGPKTKTAVKNYQKTTGTLAADGYAGKKTLENLGILIAK